MSRTPQSIKLGDWIVINDGYRVDAREVIKVTSKLIYWKSHVSQHQFRVRAVDIDFCGPHDVAVKLAQQLTSSRAQAHDETRRATERREKRDAEFIAAARAITGDKRQP